MDLGTIAQRSWEVLLDRLPRRMARVLWLFQQTVKGFADHEGPARAASIAYYALFSAFPLALFLIASSSYLLENQVAQRQIYAYFADYVPQASDIVRANIEQIMAARGTIGLVALVTFLWSASGVFSAISRAVNRAWGIEHPRPFWEEKLLALGMVLVVSLLFLPSMVASTAISLVGQLSFLGTPLSPFNQVLWAVLSVALPMSFMFVLLVLIYRLLPNTIVRWRAVLPGAALAAIAWEVAKDAFSFYLTYFARYELVYGQVEAFIILLLYFYFVGAALLMGAEFTAAYARLLRDGMDGPRDQGSTRFTTAG